MVERLPTNRAGHLARTKLVLIPVPGWWRGEGRAGRRWDWYNTSPGRCLHAPSPFIAEDLRDLIVAFLIMLCLHYLTYYTATTGNYRHRLSQSFPPGSCGARCGLRNAGWCTGCWLLGTWGASNQNFIWSHSLRWHGGGGAATTEWPGEQRNRLKMVITNNTH